VNSLSGISTDPRDHLDTFAKLIDDDLLWNPSWLDCAWTARLRGGLRSECRRRCDLLLFFGALAKFLESFLGLVHYLLTVRNLSAIEERVCNEIILRDGICFMLLCSRIELKECGDCEIRVCFFPPDYIYFHHFIFISTRVYYFHQSILFPPEYTISTILYLFPPEYTISTRVYYFHQNFFSDIFSVIFNYRNPWEAPV
jgi:hypothetical protein